MSKIFKTEIFRVDRFNSPIGKDRNDHVRLYISPGGAQRAYAVGVRRFLKDLIRDGVNATRAAHNSMCSAMRRYASDPRYGARIRVASIITNRAARTGDVFGRQEFYDPIPKGYKWALELQDGWSWFVPTIRLIRPTISDDTVRALSDDFSEFVRLSVCRDEPSYRQDGWTTQAHRTAAVLCLLAPDRASKTHKRYAAKWPDSIF